MSEPRRAEPHAPRVAIDAAAKGFRVRRATAADVPAILTFIHALALYEKEPEAVVATAADLLRDGFGADPRFFVLLAEAEEGGVDAGEPAGPGAVGPAGAAQPSGSAPAALGFAFYFFTYSTWEGRPCLFLEDLFVPPEHRGRGVGLALMRALAAEAVRAGCTRFQWQVLDWNTPAIDFYERLGGKILTDWKTVRLEKGAISALAAGG